jgi:hypothetical protein
LLDRNPASEEYCETTRLIRFEEAVLGHQRISQLRLRGVRFAPISGRPLQGYKRTKPASYAKSAEPVKTLIYVFAAISAYSTPKADDVGAGSMAKEEEPATNLTVEQCREFAAAMFEDAAALPPGPKREEILKLAHGYLSLAEMKGWMAKKVN